MAFKATGFMSKDIIKMLRVALILKETLPEWGLSIALWIVDPCDYPKWGQLNSAIFGNKGLGSHGPLPYIELVSSLSMHYVAIFWIERKKYANW